MSIQAVGAVIELRDIPTTPKMILLLLANAHNRHTDKCFPDQQRLADEANVDVKTVARHLKWLEDEKLIRRHTTHLGRGRGSETHFELLFLHRTNCRVQGDRPLTGEIKTPQQRDLDPSALRGENKKPESQPESQTGSVSVKVVADAFWKAAPDQSRKRSSRKRTEQAVQKALKDETPDRLLKAWHAYLASPDAIKDGGKFVPGIHTWINDSKFDAWLAQEPDLLAQHDRGVAWKTWAKAIGWYGETGQWDLESISPPPHRPGCKAPEDLIEKVRGRIEVMKQMEGIDA